MSNIWQNRFYTIAVSLVSAVLLVSSAGCVGLLANLMHAANGNLAPAAYAGLEGKRVAVVCVSNSEMFGPTEASMDLAKRVGVLINQNVDEINLVSPQEIANWIDRNDWDHLDYTEVGRGITADMVVAVDLDSFSLHDGKTLYKGRADLKVVVYDMNQGGKKVFTATPPQIQFPSNSGYHTTDISEAEFSQQFVTLVARRVARNFYAFDVAEDFAADVSLIRS
ncbi:MAG: hypothetical protein GY768_21655 [Planctomycetaceae bacterium]|nr:hypothetical protein [Planctomycetaceae bacterium]